MKSILFAVLALFATSCCAGGFKVEVTNTLPFERTLETVEIPWSEVTAKLSQVTPLSVVVYNTDGNQIPSQVVYNGGTEPMSLIFQATVSANSSNEYTINKNTREVYLNEAFGRYVPERKDDYAWENNMAAYRLYGPALTDPITPGIDVWVKSTPKLVIDEWFAKADYHHNYGDGMDCYKVGKTLGGGACAPYVGDSLWLSGNYATQQTLDNGPIRTTVKLTYAPFAVAGDSVTMVKVISLDANTPLSKMTNTYCGNFTSMPIAAGVIMHDVKDKQTAPKYITVTEAASDSKQPEVDGNISLAVIMPSATSTTESAGHLLIVGEAKNNQPLVYWSGASWSQSHAKDAATWNAMIAKATEIIENPLQVIY